MLRLLCQEEQVMSDDMATLLKRVRRAALAGAAVIWVAVMAALGILDNVYVVYPRYPNPGVGKTVPYEVKHVIVYITREQSAILDYLRWAEYGSGALTLISLATNQKWPLRPRGRN